ncbi:MAG: complex I subunit 1/NuoH family protein [Tepidisphaerales bacterium]
MIERLLDVLTWIPPWAYIAVFMPFFVILPTVGLLTLLERKVASWVQDRVGPNRAGMKLPFEWMDRVVPRFLRKPLAILQVAADGLKFFTKEDYRARNVDKVLFSLGPAMMVVVVMVAIAIVPWAGTKGTRSSIEVPAGQVPLTAIAQALPRHHQLIGKPSIQLLEPLPRTENEGMIPAELRREFVPQPGDPLPVRAMVTYTHGWRFQVASLDIGVLFAVSILSLAVYGVVIGGWASNNKYSFLGGLRATANMISYEIPLGLSILAVVVLFGTLDLGVIVEKQTHYWGGVLPAWNVFVMPAVAVLFLVCLHAESNRAPFDIAEAEQELVGGYHTEYSSMRFALFFLAEYFEMVVTSAILVALFLGGWHLPYLDRLFPALAGGVDPANPSVTDSYVALAVQWAVFYGKTLLVVFIFMWTRWSLPRFRFDQILGIAWRGLIPVSLALLAVSTLAVWWFGTGDRTTAAGLERIVPGPMGLALLAGNVAVLVGAVLLGKALSGDPTAPPNKRVPIPGSRFARTPLPAGVVPTNKL